MRRHVPSPLFRSTTVGPVVTPTTRSRSPSISTSAGQAADARQPERRGSEAGVWSANAPFASWRNSRRPPRAVHGDVGPEVVVPVQGDRAAVGRARRPRDKQRPRRRRSVATRRPRRTPASARLRWHSSVSNAAALSSGAQRRRRERQRRCRAADGRATGDVSTTNVVSGWLDELGGRPHLRQALREGRHARQHVAQERRGPHGIGPLTGGDRTTEAGQLLERDVGPTNRERRPAGSRCPAHARHPTAAPRHGHARPPRRDSPALARSDRPAAAEPRRLRLPGRRAPVPRPAQSARADRHGSAATARRSRATLGPTGRGPIRAATPAAGCPRDPAPAPARARWPAPHPPVSPSRSCASARLAHDAGSSGTSVVARAN